MADEIYDSADLFGPLELPVRTFSWNACGRSLRPDDTQLGSPPVGAFPNDGRMLYTPVVADFESITHL